MRTWALILVAAAMLGGCAAGGRTDGESPAARDDRDARIVADAALAVEAAEPIDPVADATPDADEEALALEADRASWPTIVVHPEDGRVPRGCGFLLGRRVRSLEGVNLAELTVEERAELALGPAR